MRRVREEVSVEEAQHTYTFPVHLPLPPVVQRSLLGNGDSHSRVFGSYPTAHSQGRWCMVKLNRCTDDSIPPSHRHEKVPVDTSICL